MSTLRTRMPLDGDWLLAPDPEDVGRDERWFDAAERPGALQATVPGVFNAEVSPETGAAWYLRAFDWTPQGGDRHVDLCFEGVSYGAAVWLNGVRLGEHEGAFTPFAFSVARHLEPGRNVLAVRVLNPYGSEGLVGLRPGTFPGAPDGRRAGRAGIVGPVYLESKAPLHIEDLYVQPDIRRDRVMVEVTVPGEARVRLRVEGTPHGVEAPAGRVQLDFPNFEAWTPDTPVLYTLRAELLDAGTVTDAVSVRFGMREFTVKDDRFHLNNHPLHLKAVVHEPDYPRTGPLPPAPETLREELALAKEAGFNMVRLRGGMFSPATLDAADELGLLVCEESPIGLIRTSPDLADRCEEAVRAMVLRDRNHPSVVIWGILNASGNAGHATDGGAQGLKRSLSELARSLDSSRLIMDDAGGAAWTREASTLMRPYRDTPEAYDDLPLFFRAPVDTDIESYCRHNGDRDRLLFISDMGFGGPEDLPDVLEAYGTAETPDRADLCGLAEAARRGFDERDLGRVFADFGTFLAAARELQADAARFQLDAVRVNPRCVGYCYGRLASVGRDFCGGVLDRWRRIKPVFKALQEAQRPVRPIIQFRNTNLVPRAESQVSVLLANEARLEGRGDLSLQVVGPTNQVLWKKKRGVKIPRNGKEIWSGTVAASGSPGPHTFVVRLMQGMKRLAENRIEFYVHKNVAPSGLDVHVLDPSNTWPRRVSRLASPRNLLAPVHIVPPLANTVRGYPDNDLLQVLAQVEGGAVAIFFEPPSDWNDLADVLDPALRATSKDATGGPHPVAHYVKMHPVFADLPSRCLMRQPYRNVAPARTFLETSDEDICGAFDTAPLMSTPTDGEATAWWGSNILVRRYGSGRIVMTHLRILENLGQDPVADQLFVNLLAHFSRRSVPSDAPLTLHRPSVEWLRGERNEQARRWMVVGPFPNWDGRGFDQAYPPEETQDFDATYPGWYRAINWKPWYSLAASGHRLDLNEACSPTGRGGPAHDYATGYAYAEFTSDTRRAAMLSLALWNPTKVWLNGNPVHVSNEEFPHDRPGTACAEVFIKQGRNTLLVKCARTPGPMEFALEIEDDNGEALPLKWWR